MISKIKEISIIGYGNFGKFIALKLKKYFKIFIYDPKVKDLHQRKKIIFSTAEECLTKEIIILSIPVQNIKNFLIDNGKYIKEKSLFIDVCSVKMKPVELMKKYLPEKSEIIATHPLFGPESYQFNKKNLKIVVIPVRTGRIMGVNNFIKKKLKLCIIEKTAEEHDKEMAIIQGLSHFIAKALNEMNIPDSELKTSSYSYLNKMMELLKNDTNDLFYTIQNENPFGKEIRKPLRASL